jgi:hypothetical protein
MFGWRRALSRSGARSATCSCPRKASGYGEQVRFRTRVPRGRRLVQDDEGGVPEQRPRKGDSLPLATGEVDPTHELRPEERSLSDEVAALNAAHFEALLQGQAKRSTRNYRRAREGEGKHQLGDALDRPSCRPVPNKGPDNSSAPPRRHGGAVQRFDVHSGGIAGWVTDDFDASALASPPFAEQLMWAFTMWRLRPENLLGALWATVAARLVRRRLKNSGLAARVPRPRHLGPKSEQGVLAALSRLKPTCLERALVLQTWMAMQGNRHDVVIGVPQDGMRSGPAHAWVDGTESDSPAIYLELHRIGPPL